MTPQDALAAALSDVLGDVQAASYIYARTVIDRLARDGWVIVNAETLAAALRPVAFAPCDDPEDEPYCAAVREDARHEAARIIAALRGDTDG